MTLWPAEPGDGLKVARFLRKAIARGNEITHGKPARGKRPPVPPNPGGHNLVTAAEHAREAIQRGEDGTIPGMLVDVFNCWLTIEHEISQRIGRKGKETAEEIRGLDFVRKMARNQFKAALANNPKTEPAAFAKDFVARLTESPKPTQRAVIGWLKDFAPAENKRRGRPKKK